MLKDLTYPGKKVRMYSLQIQTSTGHVAAYNMSPHIPSRYVKGVDGVMDAYHGALSQWGLSGPTNFAPCLTAAMNMASRHQVRVPSLN